MSFVARVEHVGDVDSTMRVARERAAAGAPAGTTIVARSQSGGRGRLGRAWFSVPDAGLWLTVVLRPPPRADGSPLSLAGIVAGVGAHRAARQLGAVAAKLKWPNDVVVGERKLCGILIEAEDVTEPSPLLLVGLGFNLAPRSSLDLPADLDERYVGLADLVPVGVASVEERERVLRVLLTELEAWYAVWVERGASPVIAAFAEVDALCGALVRAEGPGGAVVGRADGLTAAGALRILAPQGIVAITAGDVMRVRAAS